MAPAGGAVANGAAGAAGAKPGGGAPMGCGGPEQILFMVGMLVVFYFVLIRPQQKRMKQHKALVEGLKRGDSVVTSSGIYGRISAVEGSVLTLEIAKGVDIKILKSHVGGVASGDADKDLASTPQPNR